MLVQSNGKIRRTEAEWEKIFERYRESGLSDAAFCRKLKLSPNTFSKWKRAFAETGLDRPHFVEFASPPVVEAPSSAEFELSLHGGLVLRWKA